MTAKSSETRDRAAGNRENAQQSTGPKTPEGKANVRLNALRHGACAQQIVLPGEDEQAYRFLGLELMAHWKPANAHERKLVRLLQEYEWRLARLRAAETNLWALGVTEQIEKYEQHDEPTRLAFAQAAAFRANSKQFDQIGRHENRISKLLKQTEEQLREDIDARSGGDAVSAATDARVESMIDPLDPMKEETPAQTHAPAHTEPAEPANGFVLHKDVLPKDVLPEDAEPKTETAQQTRGNSTEEDQPRAKNMKVAA